MTDFEPTPADTSGRDFQEGLLGQEQLAPMPLGFWAGLGPRNDLGENAVTDAISQKLLYGTALAAHMFTSASDQKPLTPAEMDAGRVARDSEFTNTLRESARSLNPEPGTQGIGTQALAGLAGFATQVAMGGGGVGGILSVGSTSAYEGYWNAKAEGLDDATAEKMALAEGGSGALFAGLPFGSLAKNSALAVRLLAETGAGLGANVGIGATTRYAQHKILADAGYPEMAEQYKALDADSIMMDAATGLFPAVHAAAAAGLGEAGQALRKAAMLAAADRITQENGRVRDGVSVATDGRAQRERAPGIPIDQASAAAHINAERTALVQTLNKHGIDLSNTPMAEEGATFLQPPQDRAAMDAAREVFMNSLADHLGSDKALDPDARRVAQALGVPIPDEETVRQEVPVRPQAEEEEREPEARETPDLSEYDAAEAERSIPHRIATDEALRDELTKMQGETGWAQVGGKMMRKNENPDHPDHNVITGRTPWVPKQEWWAERPKGLSEAQVKGAVDKALAGEKLTKRERAMVDFMSEIADKRLKGETGAMTEAEREMYRDRAEFDQKVPELMDLDTQEKDMIALEAKARAIDHDGTSSIMESWEKDDQPTIDRVRRELQDIVNGDQEGQRSEGSKPAEGSGGPKLGEEEQPAAPAESLSTLPERQRSSADSGSAAGYSPTGSDDGDRFAGRDAAVARQALADRPDAVIVGEDGSVHPAAETLRSARDLEAQAKLEADKAFQAAADCARRQG